MAIGADDFRVRGGSVAAWADLDDSLDYLSQSPTGAAIVQEMEDKDTTIQIVHNGQDMYDPGTNTIYWDPDAAHQVFDERGRTVGVQSPALALLHEGAHAVDPHLAEHRATPSRQFTNGAEAHAIEAENIVAADLGEPQRVSHTGLPRRTDDPTAHTPMGEPEPAALVPPGLELFAEYLMRMFLRC